MEKRTRLNFSSEKYGLGLYRFPPRIGTIFHYIIYIIKKNQFQYRVSTLIIVPFSTQTICFWLWQSNNQKFPKYGNTKLLKSSDPFAGENLIRTHFPSGSYMQGFYATATFTCMYIMHTPLECHIQYAPKKYHASTKQTIMSNLLDNFTVSIKLAECEGLCPPPLTMTKITNNDRYLNLLNISSFVLL